MAETVEFEQTYFYNLYDVGIAVAVDLSCAEKLVVFDAKIDTGSTFCVF